ncbi:MAG: CvpA family protein [Verrucomicrobiota bacterium]
MNWTGNLPFNWFDVAVVLMLAAGYARGKKHGMSQESLAMLKWIALVVVSAIAYEPLGLWAADTLKIGKLFAFVLSYSLVATIIAVAFVFINRTLGEKLKGSDTFGKAEFYLAMPAGMLRFACIVLAVLALLNARYYTTAEVKAMTKYQDDNYGSNFFPTLSSMQDDVFTKSFVGKQVKEHLSFLLIKPTSPVPTRKGPATVKRKEAGF